MTSKFQNLTISDNSYIQLPYGTTSQRPGLTYTITPFTSTGTTTWTCPTNVTQIEVLVVAGGGGGYGGGGGAGGLIYRNNYPVTPGNSYTVTVGAGGTGGGNGASNKGSNSVFDTLTAIGGGCGGANDSSGPGTYQTGGSGGGGGRTSTVNPCNPGLGTAGQGYAGGSTNINNSPYPGSGGGGAGGPGNGPISTTKSGAGGPGLYFPQFISYGASGWFAGGGGGAAGDTTVGASNGGNGGGGAGGVGSSTAGTANTGGGGGGAQIQTGAGGGGSGVVLIRYALTSSSENTAGMIRYNTELKGIEVYEGTARKWISQEPNRNFGGHNIFTYSQDFVTGAWTANGASFTANTTTAPDGTTTGNTLTGAGSAGVQGYYRAYKTFTISSGVIYSVSFYAKKGTSSTIGLMFINVGGEITYNFDTGAFGLNSDNFWKNPTATNVGNGWYRISAYATSNTTNAGPGLYVAGAGQTAYVWGMQFEQSLYPGPYVKTQNIASPAPTSIAGYNYHVYTTTGTSGFSPACSGTVEVLVVAGGGAGGGAGPSSSRYGAGGGGAGGLIYYPAFYVESEKQYTVVVGAGGTGNSASEGNRGGNSQFGPLVAIGGGGGGYDTGPNGSATASGGSGGGAAPAYANSLGFEGGYTPGQGNPGGRSYPGLGAWNGGGGGGGSGGKGGNGTSSNGGNGGPGQYFPQFSNYGYYGNFAAGGGAGVFTSGSPGFGGGAGAGNGGALSNNGSNATNGTGSGGGGGSGNGGSTSGGNGGDGIVIVRYRND